MLEKRLVLNRNLMSSKKNVCHLTDLKSCYDRQLVNAGGLIEKSIERNRDAMQLL